MLFSKGCHSVSELCFIVFFFYTQLFVDDDKDPEFAYVNRLSLEQKAQLQNRPIVGIDPNKRDLIYCVSVQGQRFKSFRYTYPQVS